jgi:hypothetical protein
MKQEIFDRAEVAEMLDMEYGVVRNWSTGKPLSITPSVRSTGRKGALSLYSTNDVFKFGIAAEMVTQGVTFPVVNEMLSKLNDEWLENPGCLVLYYAIEKDGSIKSKITHLPASDDVSIAKALERAMGNQRNAWRELGKPKSLSVFTLNLFNVLGNLAAMMVTRSKRIAKAIGDERNRQSN